MATAEEKPQERRYNLVQSLVVLFAVSCIFGVIPYSGVAYYRHRIFKLSIFGNVWSLINVIHDTLQYHYATVAFSLGDKQESGIVFHHLRKI